jgi:hypothetical protein
MIQASASPEFATTDDVTRPSNPRAEPAATIAIDVLARGAVTTGPWRMDMCNRTYVLPKTILTTDLIPDAAR